MPLLRGERRAIRVRRAAVVGAAGVLAAGGVTAAVLFHVLDGSGSEAEPAPAPEPVAGAAAAPAQAEAEAEPEGETAPETAPEPAVATSAPTALGATTRTSRVFGQARGFRDALVRAGANSEECDEIERAMTGVLDFRRCQPTDELAFERDSGGHLVLFEYVGGPIEKYRAVRGPIGELEGSRVEVPIERVRVARGGRIRTSLGAAFEAAGLGRALVGRFSEVFEAKANFTTHARVGDSFRIIADEERVGGEMLRWGAVHAVEYVGQRTGTLRGYWFEPRTGDGDYFDETGRAVHGSWLRTPVRYDRISSRFNPRRLHPILRRVVPHNGVDYAAGHGTPVWAAADGEVIFAGERGANGNLIGIRHASGYETYYAHLSRFERGIRTGVTVRQRAVIGYVGSTGRSTGPHLHFGLKRGSQFVDPLEVIHGPGRMLPGGVLGRFRTDRQRLDRELARISVGEGPDVGGSGTGGGAAAAASDEPVEEPMD